MNLEIPTHKIDKFCYVQRSSDLLEFGNLLPITIFQYASYFTSGYFPVTSGIDSIIISILYTGRKFLVPYLSLFLFFPAFPGNGPPFREM